MEKITEQEASQLGKKIKSRKRTESKVSLIKNSPLKHQSTAPVATRRRATRQAYVKRWDPHQGEGTDAEKLLEIERQIDSVSGLPKTSKYAQHKLKVLEKARQLLQAG